MLNEDIPTVSLWDDPAPQTDPMERLRQGTNPFATQVATVGTAEETLRAGVPEYAANQLADLFEIIDSYREGRPPTRVYPLLGDRGAGKTHLLYTLRAELQKRARESGAETLLIVVDRLSEGMDAIDYLLWLIVNYLLARKGNGERMLGVIAGRLTGRLLSEGLRRLAPHQRVQLIPPTGFWDQFRLRVGSTARAQERLEAIEGVIACGDRKNPSPEDLRNACQEAGLSPDAALDVIKLHLNQSESTDVHGWFRKQLYGRLARLALRGDREAFEELHAGDYEEAPANVANAGNLSRCLLEVWLELLSSLGIPVVVVFDQLEDYLRAADREQEKINCRYFTDATSLFVNDLRHVCILIFAEQGLWTDLLNRAESYASERLRQPLPLPGRPARPHLLMPNHVSPEALRRLIEQRVRTHFPDLDLTGLPPTFPFAEGDVQALGEETSIRDCLRRLAKRYDEIVFARPAEKAPLDRKLEAMWKEKLAAMEEAYREEIPLRGARIPEVQNALQGWLECLDRHGLKGTPAWRKIEMLEDSTIQPYGNLSLIRTEGPHKPGIGIAAWLGNGSARPRDLQHRLGFFQQNPCPIRTLVMLRLDGEAALVGETRAVYDKARKAGHDIRIQKYEPRHLFALMALTAWHQAALTEVEEAKATDPRAEQILHDFVSKLSAELSDWIAAWRKPRSNAKGE